jgi:hypothetical protein
LAPLLQPLRETLAVQKDAFAVRQQQPLVAHAANLTALGLAAVEKCRDC